MEVAEGFDKRMDENVGAVEVHNAVKFEGTNGDCSYRLVWCTGHQSISNNGSGYEDIADKMVNDNLTRSFMSKCQKRQLCRKRKLAHETNQLHRYCYAHQQRHLQVGGVYSPAIPPSGKASTAYRLPEGLATDS
jgi:hypothetical protein